METKQLTLTSKDKVLNLEFKNDTNTNTITTIVKYNNVIYTCDLRSVDLYYNFHIARVISDNDDLWKVICGMNIVENTCDNKQIELSCVFEKYSFDLFLKSN